MKKLFLFLGFLCFIVLLFAACKNETPQPQDTGYSTPTIIGRIVAPNGSVSSSLYVMVGETGNVVQASSDGSFVISGLEENKGYTLYFTNYDPKNPVIAGSTSSTRYGLQKRNVVASKDLGNDIGTVNLLPTVAVSGKVVMSNDQQPLPDVSVKIPGTAFSASTDSSGNYIIKDIPQGSYEIRYEKEGYKAVSSSFSTDIASENLSLVIPDVKMYENIGYSTPTIVGRIVAPNGSVSSSLYVMVGETGNVVQASSDGSFVISGLEENKGYTLYFTNYDPKNPVIAGSTSSTRYGLQKRNVVASKDLGNDIGTVNLLPTVAVSGKVVMSNDQQPLPDVSVKIPGTAFSASTDSSGNYIIKDIPQGSYEIRYEKEGYKAVSSSFSTDIASENLSLVIPDVKMYENIGYSTPTIVGRIVAPSGSVPSSLYAKVGETGNVVQASSDGSFVISGLEENKKYTLYFTNYDPTNPVIPGSASSTRYGLQMRSVVASKGVGNNIETVNLLPTVTVSGKVVMSNGQALPDVSVKIPGIAFSASTDSSGNYNINVPQGFYNILYEKEGYKTVSSSFSTIASENLSLTIPDVTMYESLETLVFGKNNNGQPIEWLVLDKKGNKTLVISKDILFQEKYNDAYSDVTWETCTLRSYLNNSFRNLAFTEEEKKLIAKSTIENPDNKGTEGGNDTEDYIFLLSIDEVNKYFKTDKDRACGGEWWLRTPGESQSIAACVWRDGGICYYGVDYSNGVRPALWLELNQ